MPRRLNLHDALKLYDLVGHHLPDIDPTENVIGFIGTIIDAIVDAGEHRNYVDALVLLTGKPMDEVLQMKPLDALAEFSDGLAMNNILLLKRFAMELGYGR